MPQEGQEGNAYHVYDKEGIELESVDTPAAAEEMAEPIGGYVMYGGTQTTDETGTVLRIGGKEHADFRGATEPVDAAEGLSPEDRERFLAQQNRQASPSAPSATTVQVSGGGDLLGAAASILGGLVSRDDFQPGQTEDAAVTLAVNLAQQLAAHPVVAAAQATAPVVRAIQGGAPGGNIFNSPQAKTVAGPDGNPVYIPPRRVKMVKNGKTFYVDPHTAEGKEAVKQQQFREAQGRAATDF